MTTEDMVEEFIELGVKAYKKNSGDCLEARRLSRHEPIMIDGYEFCYWREYTVYRMVEYISKVIPTAKVEVELDGNNSTIQIELDDSEQEKLNREMFLFLEKISKLKSYN